MRPLFSLLFLLFAINLKAVVLDVRIFSGNSISSFFITVSEGRYKVLDTAGEHITDLNQEQQLQLSLQNKQILLSREGIILGSYPGIQLQGRAFWNAFTITPANNLIKPRTYDADLICTPSGKDIRLINRVPIEAYIAGVILSESGSRALTEYYKVQATISRTYALSSMNRHSQEGFHLCDQVHCQAYYGNARLKNIIDAVDASRNDAIVDSNGKFITAAFHASCGGHTINSEDVWATALPYLRARPDTFCLHHPTSHWRKTLSRKEFFDYLEKKFKYKPTAAELNNFSQSARRTHLDANKKIPLRTMRTDLELRSTFFTIELTKDSVILTGKGHGHGVGLCQIGAMRMAELGFSYPEIIAFYYFNTILKIAEE